MNGHNSGNEISSTSEYTDSKCNIFQEKWKSYYIHKSVLTMQLSVAIYLDEKLNFFYHIC